MQKEFMQLEYNKIIEFVSNYCKTYIGKRKVLELEPSFSFYDVEKNLNLTTETLNLKTAFGNIPLNELPEIEKYLKLLESGISLSCKGLLDISKHLSLSRELKEYFYSNYSESTASFSLLQDIFYMLYVNESIEKNIISKIIDENTIADNASTTLANLRKKKKVLEQRLKDKLLNLIHSNSKLIMDPIITMRDNRYVIPIKEEFRNEIKGLIHDISASGSTVYIEPISTFDINNEIQNIKIDEDKEIEQILKNLTLSLLPYVKNIRQNIDIIGTIDCLSAKSIYSMEISGNEPILNTKRCINLLQVKHPLIEKNTVVPIDVSIGENYSCLIITGPNTGGKTATLKTVGLNLLMAYSGIYPICSSNSSICVFDNIFIDIGDEQSIQESLSTFSSHMLNIVNITKLANSNSLILLDELGSGTDPIEGSRLAISILKFFHEKGCIVFATTHYSELKNYALVTDGFENASCSFDVEKLSPTYQLLIGIPGRSNAFAISKRLGLSEKILDDAYNSINQDNIHIEDVLKNIYDNKIQIEKEKTQINRNLNQIQNLRKDLEKQKASLDEKNNELEEEAKLKAKEILLSTKEEANYIIKELNNMLDSNTINLKKANKLRSNLNDKLIYTLNNNTPQNSSFSSNLSGSENTRLKNSDISIGLNVFITSLQKSATVLSLPNHSKEVLVQIGNIKMNVKLNDLSLLKNQNRSASKVTIQKNGDFKAKTISPEINVIGLNVEDATQIIDKYLDDCSLANITTIRIIHGKGTGKLMNGIHQYLKNNKQVKDFRLGLYGEGETGVTVVTLK